MSDSRYETMSVRTQEHHGRLKKKFSWYSAQRVPMGRGPPWAGCLFIIFAYGRVAVASRFRMRSFKKLRSMPYYRFSESSWAQEQYLLAGPWGISWTAVRKSIFPRKLAFFYYISEKRHLWQLFLIGFEFLVKNTVQLSSFEKNKKG